MNINTAKTKILVVSRHGTQAHCTLDGERLENVDSFTYLGGMITSDGRSKPDVIRPPLTKSETFSPPTASICT
jgi:hypothetical protein